MRPDVIRKNRADLPVAPNVPIGWEAGKTALEGLPGGGLNIPHEAGDRPARGPRAAHAATRYGARVTTTTISRAQHDYVREKLAREGLTDRVELLLVDYRRLSGRFDKAVSIEMFEAVGLPYYDRFFSAVDRLLVLGRQHGPLGRKCEANRLRVAVDGDHVQVAARPGGLEQAQLGWARA